MVPVHRKFLPSQHFLVLTFGSHYRAGLEQVNGGREGRPIGAYELAKAVEDLGAGEILLNCIDCDGQFVGVISRGRLPFSPIINEREF